SQKRFTFAGFMHSISPIRDLPISAPPQGEASLLEKYLAVRETSLQICTPLSVEDHSLQPMPDASPAKWHLAHTTWFFETFLLPQPLPLQRSHEQPAAQIRPADRPSPPGGPGLPPSARNS